MEIKLTLVTRRDPKKVKGLDSTVGAIIDADNNLVCLVPVTRIVLLDSTPVQTAEALDAIVSTLIDESRASIKLIQSGPLEFPVIPQANRNEVFHIRTPEVAISTNEAQVYA